MESNIDEAFLHFHELIAELSALEGRLIDHHKEEAISMEIEAVDMGLPVQLDIVINEQGKVSIGTVPPLYQVATSFEPVFHQLSLTLEKSKEV